MRKPATALLILAAFAASCTANLDEQYERQPLGRFATGELGHLSALGEPAPARPTFVGLEVVDGGGPPPSMNIPLSGPVRSEDLAPIGIEVEPSVLADLQREGWSPGKSLDLVEVRRAFLARNPAVAAAVQRHRASFARYSEIQYLNDLVHQYDAFAGDLRTNATTPQVLPQQTPWPLAGAARIQSDVVDADVAASSARLTKAVLGALVGLEEAYQAALFQRRSADVLEQDTRLVEQVVVVARSTYRAGRGSYAHVLLAENVLAKQREMLETARQRLHAELRRLAAMLDLSDLDALLSAQLEPKPSLAQLPEREQAREAALATGPDVLEAAALAKRAELMVQLVERQLLPDVSPGTSRTRMGEIPARKADIQYATRAPFLVELRTVRDAARDAATQARRQAPARADAQWVSLSDARRLYQLFSGKQRKRAKQAWDAASSAYRAEQATFFDVDESLSRLLEIDLQAQGYRRDVFVAAARLAAITGDVRSFGL